MVKMSRRKLDIFPCATIGDKILDKGHFISSAEIAAIS